MTGFYYDHTTHPIRGAQSSSTLTGAEFEAIQTGFDKLPTPTGFPNAMVKVRSAETGLDLSVATLTSAGVAAGLTGITSTGTVDFTGATITVPTQSAGNSSAKAASTAFVAATAFSSALPAQASNSGKVITTDGTNASWSLIGTASQSLRVNSAGTALEGFTPSSAASNLYLNQNAGGF